MADERVIIELALQGVQETVRNLFGVSQAQQDLARTVEQAGTRQAVSYQEVAKAAQQAADVQIAAAARAQQAAQQAAQNTGVGGQGRNPATGQFVSQAAASALAQTQAAFSAPQIANLGGLTQRIAAVTQATQQQATAAKTATTSTAQQAAALRTLAAQAQQAAAAQDMNTAAGRRASAQLLSNAAAAIRQANALESVKNATGNASRGNITYLSVLSAIHAASFLATNQTFSMIGSMGTLTLAFGKVAVAGAVVGAALGATLAIFGQINQAIQQIQNASIGGAEAIAGFAAVAGGVAIAAGTAGVKVAANVESQLAAVRAFGGATTEQLAIVEEQAGQFARQFGIAAADVVQATALFSKAGGSVKEAIAGATEAIVKLQIASAGELSQAQSATVLSAALRQFNLTGAEAAHVSDVLTAAFQGSALSATGVQQAFVQAAPGAAALGISIDDLGAAIALIGDRLVKGTITGTAFKQAILDLISPSTKAQEIFRQYGITIEDASGNTLPLVDIVGQLNAAFGKMVDEEGNVIKQQDAATIAALGGARAFLAFNVLTEQGATGLQKYREALDKVSATDIANVLLLPLNKQIEVLKVNIQEVSKTFGGPLLAPIRAATVAAIGFFQGVIPYAKLLGEAIATVVTGQGFEALQANINKLVGQKALASFLIEVVNSFRNVADVIYNQIIPAIQDMVNTIGQAISTVASLDTIGTTFSGLNTSIQNIGATIASAIRAFGTLVAEMILNEGAGGRLRDTIDKLANAILINLASAMTTAVVTFQAAIVALPLVARISLVTAAAVLKLAGALKELALKAVDIEQAGAKISVGFGNPFDIEEQKRLQQQRAEIDKQSNALREGIASDTKAAQELAAGIAPAVQELDKLQEMLKGTGAAAQEGGHGIITVFDDLQGTIPTIISNVMADIEKAQKEAVTAATGGAGGVGVPSVDTKAIDAVQKRIAEATSDVSRRLADLQVDAGQKAQDTASRAIDRIAELQQTTAERILETIQTAQDRIKDLFRNVDERRADRQTLDDFKQGQEERLTAWQRELDKEDQVHARSLDHQRTDRQRDNEDIARGKEQELADDETHFSRFQDIAQRAFQRVQQARETAFSRAQDIETTAFQRGLDREARQRDFALALAQAKTPEERQRIIQQQQQAVQDTAFRQGQEDKLTKFRLAQEDKRTKFTQSQEEQAVGFRNGLEDASLAHRRQNELVLLDFRRKAENTERGIRDREEDAELQRRLDREDILTARRSADAKALQQEQDRLENIRNEEQAQRIRDEALQTVNKEIGKAQEQIDKVIEDATRALDEQATDVEKQTRNIINTLIDLKDDFPPDVLAAIGDQLAGSLAEAGAKAEVLKGQLQAIRAQRLGEIQIEGATAAANLQMLGQQQLQQLQAPTQPSVPLGVLAVQTIQAASFVFPPGLEGPLGLAVLNALRQADLENIDLTGPGVQPDFTPLTNLKEGLDRWFR